jgi:uncharacterized protein
VQGEHDADVAARVYLSAEGRSTSLIAYTECRAAIAAAQRVGSLARSDARKARDLLDGIWADIDRLSVDEEIVYRAGELAERQALRGFDAIHLASALVLLPDAAIVSWDDQLSRAAQAEGLSLARSRTSS